MQQDSPIDPSYSFYQLLTTDTDCFTFAIPGDVNGDRKVDGSDVAILAGNWQSTNATWWDGDFNKDQEVDGSDVAILAGNWQVGVEPSMAVAVPEPQGRWPVILLRLSLSVLFLSRR